MKKNVRFMLKVAIISVLFIFVVAARSFAAETGGVNFNVDFTNIPEADSSSSGSSSGTGTTTDSGSTSNSGSSTTSTDAGNSNSSNSSSTSSSSSSSSSSSTSSSDSSKKTTSTSSTSSTSSTKMPATGSNVEIIFGVAAIVIVSGAIFLFRKQSIKLK